jgi:nucleoside-diphosphate-sugar epimerase
MATILLAGGTGLIGSVVLETALASSRVAKVYSLQRRHLPDNHIHKKNIKLRELVLQDPAAWTAWPSEVRDQLKSVDGCIWCA